MDVGGIVKNAVVGQQQRRGDEDQLATTNGITEGYDVGHLHFRRICLHIRAVLVDVLFRESYIFPIVDFGQRDGRERVKDAGTEELRVDVGDRGWIECRVTNPVQAVGRDFPTKSLLETGSIEIILRVTVDVQRVAEFIIEIRVRIKDAVASGSQGKERVDVDLLRE